MGLATQISSYYDCDRIRAEVEKGHHRELVGGLWEEIGRLQFRFLEAHGLMPNHYFLDVGCGSLRGGIHFIRYLDPNHYFGCDLNESLIQAGIEREIRPHGLDHRIGPNSFAVSEEFEFQRLDAQFDYALALSLFTHLPPDKIRLCLAQLWPKMHRGGRFYATFFEPPEASHGPHVHWPGGVTTYPDRDPFHQSQSLYQTLVSDLPWSMNYIGEWDHPRAQKILEFTRL
jgi:SAM-dependent methyltransferase